MRTQPSPEPPARGGRTLTALYMSRTAVNCIASPAAQPTVGEHWKCCDTVLRALLGMAAGPVERAWNIHPLGKSTHTNYLAQISFAALHRLKPGQSPQSGLHL